MNYINYNVNCLQVFLSVLFKVIRTHNAMLPNTSMTRTAKDRDWLLSSIKNNTRRALNTLSLTPSAYIISATIISNDGNDPPWCKR